MEPTVCGVPYDTIQQARKAGYKELIQWLQTGRGAERCQERQLLFKAVQEWDRERGLV